MSDGSDEGKGNRMSLLGGGIMACGWRARERGRTRQGISTIHSMLFCYGERQRSGGAFALVK